MLVKFEIPQKEASTSELSPGQSIKFKEDFGETTYQKVLNGVFEPKGVWIIVGWTVQKVTLFNPVTHCLILFHYHFNCYIHEAGIIDVAEFKITDLENGDWFTFMGSKNLNIKLDDCYVELYPNSIVHNLIDRNVIKVNVDVRV